MQTENAKARLDRASQLYKASPPLISEQEYRKYEVQQLVENYFDNSVSNLVSFFMKDDNLKKSDLDDLAAFIEKNRSKS